MRPIEPPFELQVDQKTIMVSEHSVAGERVFYLEFPDARKALKLIVAEKRPSGEKFWTSIPQGRQEEAEQFGKLIAAYIRGKKKQ